MVVAIAPVTMALQEAEAEVHVGADSERGTEAARVATAVMTGEIISLSRVHTKDVQSLCVISFLLDHQHA